MELDKVKIKLEHKDKELKELIKEISKYDQDFHSEVGSVLEGANNSSVLHNESVINELSFINPHANNNNKSMIEKGPIGGGGKAAPADVDDAGYLQFETPENGNGLGMQTTPRTQRKTYSKSINKDRV